MSAPAATRCTCCMQATDNLNREDMCLTCENVQLQTDAYAVDVVLNTIEAAVRQALELNYVHPDDVLTRVGQVIREHGDNRALPLAELMHRIGRNLDGRHGGER